MDLIGKNQTAWLVVGSLILVLLGWAYQRQQAREKREKIEMLKWRSQQFNVYARFMQQVTAALNGDSPPSVDEVDNRIYLKSGVIHFFEPQCNSWRQAQLHSKEDASRLAQRIFGISNSPGPYRV